MAGEARTSSFILGSATVMIGPLGSLYDLTPDLHSIGLVKNFQVTAEPNYLDLTQGVKSTIVYQVLTANPVKAQCEVYEYTSKNFAYALGLQGTTAVSPAGTFSLITPIAGSTTTPVVSMSFGDGQGPDPVIPAGTWISVQDPNFYDHVHYVRTTADSTETGNTITVQIDPMTSFKSGDNFPAGSTVSLVNSFDIGNKNEAPFFAVKVVSIMPEGRKPVALLFPKVRITRGFSVTFGETNYGNMPFQFTPFELLPVDTFYNDFHNHGYGRLLAAT